MASGCGNYSGGQGGAGGPWPFPEPDLKIEISIYNVRSQKELAAALRRQTEYVVAQLEKNALCNFSSGGGSVEGAPSVTVSVKLKAPPPLTDDEIRRLRGLLER